MKPFNIYIMLFKQSVFLKLLSLVMFLMALPALLDYHILLIIYPGLGFYTMMALICGMTLASWMIIVLVYTARCLRLAKECAAVPTYRLVGSFIPFSMMILPGITNTIIGFLLLFSPFSVLLGRVCCFLLKASPEEVYSNLRIYRR